MSLCPLDVINRNVNLSHGSYQYELVEPFTKKHIAKELALISYLVSICLKPNEIVKNPYPRRRCM